MSRHRDIKNLNIQDELDDAALSDGGDNDMTEEESTQMQTGLERVRIILGNEGISGVTDKTIKDALWHYYFDAEQTVNWVMEEQQRRRLARERKEISLNKALPPVPQENLLHVLSSEHLIALYEPDQSIERSRVPLIVLAQQGENSQDLEEIAAPRCGRLSTITERTERTELTPRWSTRRGFTTSDRGYSSTISSYGEVIECPDDNVDGSNPLNLSSGSMLRDLPLNESAPFFIASECVPNATPSPQTSQLPNDHHELSDIPTPSSKLSERIVAPPQSSSKKSKLSLLASSRTNAAASHNSSPGLSSLSLSDSVNLCSGLRPSNLLDSSPDFYAITDMTPPHQCQNESMHSSTSSVVRQAIKTALELEAIDKQVTTRHSQRPVAGVGDLPPSSSFSNSSPTHTYKEVRTFGPSAVHKSSKLAMLAVSKASANKNLKLPEPVTEYLTPIANGSTVTTAITTSYQNLRTLTDPATSRIIPEQHVVPLGSPALELKQSKLAMKIKKNGTKPVVSSTEAKTLPMFIPRPSAHVRASPSTFASLLFDDILINRKAEDKGHPQNSDISADTPSQGTLRNQIGLRNINRKFDHLLPPVNPPSTGFRFDQPSPDDIVFNARRGTPFSQHKRAPLPSSTLFKLSSE